jgi:hypothetical protein
MRLIDFVLFVAEHDDHHLGAITELRRDVASGRAHTERPTTT